MNKDKLSSIFIKNAFLFIQPVPHILLISEKNNLFTLYCNSPITFRIKKIKENESIKNNIVLQSNSNKSQSPPNYIQFKSKSCSLMNICEEMTTCSDEFSLDNTINNESQTTILIIFLQKLMDRISKTFIESATKRNNLDWREKNKQLLLSLKLKDKKFNVTEEKIINGPNFVNDYDEHKVNKTLNNEINRNVLKKTLEIIKNKKEDIKYIDDTFQNKILNNNEQLQISYNIDSSELIKNESSEIYSSPISIFKTKTIEFSPKTLKYSDLNYSLHIPDNI